MKQKFRAWDEDNKNFICPHQCLNDKNFFCGFNDGGNIEVSRYGGKGSWKVFPLFQFTNFYTGGIQDSRHEIYDGHILLLNCGTHQEIKGFVFWNKFRGTWGVQSSINHASWWALAEVYDNAKIIGTVQENPELLENGDAK